MRASGNRADAGGRLPLLLRLHGLRGASQAEARRLLRVLFLRFGAVPAGPDRAVPLVSRVRSILFSWPMLFAYNKLRAENEGGALCQSLPCFRKQPLTLKQLIF